MKFFSYVVARDFGFAPNPFHGICSLATCKPMIREKANIGDWIIGTGSSNLNCQNKLIYAMQVTEKITYNQYSINTKYRNKKPVMNGSLVQMYGDNIYFKNLFNEWSQENSHHSNEDGTINMDNLKRDTSSQYVLLSNNFYYFGNNYIDIPNNLVSSICKKGPGFRYIDDIKNALILIDILEKNYQKGNNGNPIQFINKFERYDGIS
jgi:hypothetical protein